MESRKKISLKGLVIKLFEKSGLISSSSVQEDVHASTLEHGGYNYYKETQNAWLEMEYNKARAVMESQKRHFVY